MSKRIGILGGMSPESTVEYYQHITRTYVSRYGDYNYPEVLIFSVSFQPYVDWPNQGQWDRVAGGLAEAARSLEAAGADFIIIATNTMHLVFDQVQAAVGVPMLSLLDVTAAVIKEQGLVRVGLLGTRFTMESNLYPETLADVGIEVLVPEAADRDFVNRTIYDELVAGQVRDESRVEFIGIVNRLVSRGAQGIILGCTEIPLLLCQADVEVPLFDTTTIHAQAALDYALG